MADPKGFLALCGLAFAAQTAALLSGPVSVPLFADEGTGTYRVYFTAGTPPQNFNLTVDTNKPAICLLSKGYRADRTDCNMPQGSRHLYDSSLSSSAQRLPDQAGYPVLQPYVDVACKLEDEFPAFTFWGLLTSDVSQLCDGFFGFKCVNATPSVRLNLSVIAEVDGQLSPSWHNDGIFGISFEFGFDDANDDEESPMRTLLKTFEDPQITVSLKRSPSSSRNIAGQLTLGGIDSANCGSDWYEMLGMDGDVTCPSHWCLATDSITFGTTSTKMFGVISIDTSTATSYVGAALVHTVADALNAEYSASRGIWTVSCDLVGKAPDLVLHTDEGNSKGDLRISSVDYIVPLPSDAKRCQLLFSSTGVTDQYWSLGTTLLKSYCVRYNLNVYRHVFFARALQ